jgi:DNA-binding transcriptional LysR family regulator
MVRAGEGVAIVPSLTIFGNDDAVRVLRLGTELPPRVIALAHLREALLSPAARQFKQLAMPVWRHILDGTPHAWERAAS